ncbi:MAG: hypothetical protein SVU32_05000, partial [Candidatus Nanohaloarchaea archaeon]|nr:hypothetical protein [Candidatus Nanohaloarchaea archaeon]
MVNANFSGNDKTASTTLYVDDSPPEAKEPNPTAGNVTDPTPRISLNYSDGDGIGVDTGKIVVRLNGRNVPHSNIETLTGSHLAFTPAKQ